VLNARPDPLLALAAAPQRGRRLGRPGEVEEVRALGLVELQRARQRLKHAFGDTAHVAALQPGVVRDADSGQDRDLLAPEFGKAAAAVDRQADLLRRDPGSPRGQELSDLAPGVHAISVDPCALAWETLPVPLSTGTLTPAHAVLS